MTARIVIEFQGGTSKEIELSHAIESNHPGLQAIEFRETRDDVWVLYFTKRTMDGRKIKSITFTNPS